MIHFSWRPDLIHQGFCAKNECLSSLGSCCFARRGEGKKKKRLQVLEGKGNGPRACGKKKYTLRGGTGAAARQLSAPPLMEWDISSSDL